MKKYIMLIIFPLLILCVSCTKQTLNESPLNYSMMPRYLDLDSIQPVFNLDTNDVVDSSYSDFTSIPLDSGYFYSIFNDTIMIPGGVLISDRKAALYVFYREAYKRFETEARYAKYLMRTYYDKAKAAEVLYQDEIVRLRKKSERTWLEKNIGYVGFLAGVATAILTEFAVFQASH